MPTETTNPNDLEYKTVLSLRKVRLTSTFGHCCIIEAGKPTKIPNVLFTTAAENGCVDYNPEMIEAFKKAILSSTAGDESDSVDYISILDDAVRNVLIAADQEPELLTAYGIPRTPVVREGYKILATKAGVDPDAFKVSVDLVEDSFNRVKPPEEKGLAFVEEDRYPGGILDDDGEAGGLDDEAIDAAQARAED